MDLLRTLPKAILFDLDNTLYPYALAHAQALKAAEGKAASLIGIAASDFLIAYESGRQQVKSALNGTAASHSRLLYFQRALELLGMRAQPLLAMDLEQTYWRNYMMGMKIFPDVLEVLEILRELRIPLAIVTDLTAHIQFKKLVWLKIDHLFDVVVTSEEAGADKPDSRPFQLAVKKLAISDGPIVMIGDSLEADILGAKAALGAITWHKTDSATKSSKESRADLTFDHFAQVLDWLGALRKSVVAV